MNELKRLNRRLKDKEATLKFLETVKAEIEEDVTKLASHIFGFTFYRDGVNYDIDELVDINKIFTEDIVLKLNKNLLEALDENIKHTEEYITTLNNKIEETEDANKEEEERISKEIEEVENHLKELEERRKELRNNNTVN